jgi:hypothetical protein
LQRIGQERDVPKRRFIGLQRHLVLGTAIDEIEYGPWQAAAEINAKGGVLGGTQFEIVHFDNKSSPQESVLLFSGSA